MDNWYRIKDKLPGVGKELLVYNPNWVDAAYCPDGIRIGVMIGEDIFLVDAKDGEGYYSLCYRPKNPDYPTHWQPKPVPPKD